MQLLIICLCLQQSGPSNEEMVSIIRHGNIQSRESINTVRMRIEITDIPVLQHSSELESKRTSPIRSEVQWWQDGPMVRSRNDCQGYVDEFLLKDGQLKSLGSQPRKGGKPYLNGALAADKWIQHNNPWCDAIFNVGFEDFAPITVLLDRANFKGIEKTEDPGKLILYKTSFETKKGAKGELLFDPKLNYLARKITTWGEDASTRVEVEALSFREVKPGIFFPETVERRYCRDKQKSVQVTRRLRFKEVVVNEPIPPGVFQLTFPAGTYVGDAIKGVGYLTDEHEQPANKLSPLPKSIGSDIGYPTGMEPNKAEWPVLPITIGVGVLLTTVALGIWLRLKKARTA